MIEPLPKPVKVGYFFGRDYPIKFYFESESKGLLLGSQEAPMERGRSMGYGMPLHAPWT